MADDQKPEDPKDVPGAAQVPIKKKHPALIVLRILLAGHPVKIGEEEYHYCDGVFGVKRERHDGKTGAVEEVVVGVEMDIAAFIKWCEKIPEKTMMQLIFGVTLAELKKVRRP